MAERTRKADMVRKLAWECRCGLGRGRLNSAGETAARNVLDAREKFPGSTLADLYDPLAMPAELVKAHAELDRAVDLCYRPQPFQSDRQRVEYLFGLYEKLTAPLLPAGKSRRRKA